VTRVDTRYLALASILIPISCILIAWLLSGFFNPFENALSDLGHAVKSRVAPVFNGGLVFGGLLAYSAALVSKHTPRIHNAVLAYTGISLMLIGVYDEVYRGLHFTVSVMFFLGTMVFLATVSVREKSKVVRPLSATALIVEVITWVVYFTYRVPRGAAIPELASVACFTPFYLYIYCIKYGWPAS